MKLDFVIPGSATPAFFSQIAFFRLCLNALGGVYARARVVAVLGDHDSEDIPAPWARHLGGVEVIWAHPPGAPNPMHRAQSDGCFAAIRDNAHIAFLCDADIAPMRPFRDLLELLSFGPALAGVMAHYHFTAADRTSVPIDQRTPETDWPDLAQQVLGKPIRLEHPYSLMDPASPQRAPFYINYGVLAGPPHLLKRFHARDLVIRRKVAAIKGDWWGAQISLALTVADLDMPAIALPLRYNYPNDPIADALQPGELQKAVFLHYLRHDRFDRQKIFADQAGFETFLGLDLDGSNKVFQDFVRARTGGVYPFG